MNFNDIPIPGSIYEVLAEHYHPDCAKDPIRRSIIAKLYEKHTKGYTLPVYANVYDLSTKQINKQWLEEHYKPSGELLAEIRQVYTSRRPFPKVLTYKEQVETTDESGTTKKRTVSREWTVPAILQQTVFRQGTNWLYRDNAGQWRTETKYNLETSLKRDFFIPHKCIERLMDELHDNYIDGVINNPFAPPGIQNPNETQGKRVLNTSTWKLVEPRPEPTAWDDPAIELWRTMIEGMFNHGELGDLQFRTFQQVMRRMVKSLYHRRMIFHQHVHIASSGTGCGKSGLLAALGIMVRGNTFNITRLLDSGFNGSEMDSVLWTMDDEVMDDKKTEALTPLIKQLISNPVKIAEAKFANRIQKTQLNPIFTVSNMTEIGLAMVPRLGPDTKDKTHLFVIKRPGGGFVYPELTEFKRAMERAMPAIVRHYLDAPDDTELLTNSDPRYQIAPFHHPDLDNHSKLDENQTAARALLELLAEARPRHSEAKDWTAQKLIAELRLALIPCDYPARALGKALAALAASGEDWITSINKQGINRYTIDLDKLRQDRPKLIQADLSAYGIHSRAELERQLNELRALRLRVAELEKQQAEPKYPWGEPMEPEPVEQTAASTPTKEWGKVLRAMEADVPF